MWRCVGGSALLSGGDRVILATLLIPLSIRHRCRLIITIATAVSRTAGTATTAIRATTTNIESTCPCPLEGQKPNLLATTATTQRNKRIHDDGNAVILPARIRCR